MGLEWMEPALACALRLLRGKKGQGATEYLLVLATAAIVVVVVLAMVNGMRAAAPTSVVVNNTTQTLSQAIRSQFANMTQIVSP